tara:strand:- start:237 stop:728 length:492 start_codon:yes stop_codon:yes gene_type:complete
MALTKILDGGMPSGSVVQVVHTSTGAMSTSSTTAPYDDTIMQITEGFEVMTLDITPTSASNKLLIRAQAHVSPGANSLPTMGLFVGTTADALASTFMHAFGSGDYPRAMTLEHFMTSGSTNALTFRVRIGMNQSGTTTFNGRSGSRFHGGSLASTITIMEIVE